MDIPDDARVRTGFDEEFPFVIRRQFTPYIAWKIFRNLDKNTLVKCRAVSTTWKFIIDYHSNLWRDVSRARYQEAARNGRIDICRLIIDNRENKNPKGKRGLTILHHAAGHGLQDICTLIMDRVDNKNPSDVFGITPLHWAASEGHFNICQLIVNQMNQ